MCHLLKNSRLRANNCYLVFLLPPKNSGNIWGVFLFGGPELLLDCHKLGFFCNFSIPIEAYENFYLQRPRLTDKTRGSSALFTHPAAQRGGYFDLKSMGTTDVGNAISGEEANVESINIRYSIL